MNYIVEAAPDVADFGYYWRDVYVFAKAGRPPLAVREVMFL